MAETRFGSFDELLEITPEELRPLVLKLQTVIMGIDPDSCEVVRLGDRAATYGVGPKKMKEGYTYILPHKSWVNLGFFRGAMLPDPQGLLEGTGKSMRHIKIRTIEDCDKAEIKKLIEVAFQERKDALMS